MGEQESQKRQVPNPDSVSQDISGLTKLVVGSFVVVWAFNINLWFINHCASLEVVINFRKQFDVGAHNHISGIS